jgi:hypothetical protein
LMFCADIGLLVETPTRFPAEHAAVFVESWPAAFNRRGWWRPLSWSFEPLKTLWDYRDGLFHWPLQCSLGVDAGSPWEERFQIIRNDKFTS